MQLALQIDSGNITSYEASQPLPVHPFNMCVDVYEQFKEALTVNQAAEFLINKIKYVAQMDAKPLPKTLRIEKIHPEQGKVASLDIDFFANRLVTYFRSEEKSVKLSCALGIIQDLSEIFAKIADNIKKEELELLKQDFKVALTLPPTASREMKLKLHDKELVALYPNNGRAVFTTTRGQSSTPLEMVQSCAHLFDPAFAQEICPEVNLKVSVDHLRHSLHSAYLGRCLLGIIHGVAINGLSQPVGMREMGRIISLIQFPGSAFYSAPIY